MNCKYIRSWRKNETERLSIKIIIISLELEAFETPRLSEHLQLPSFTYNSILKVVQKVMDITPRKLCD